MIRVGDEFFHGLHYIPSYGGMRRELQGLPVRIGETNEQGCRLDIGDGLVYCKYCYADVTPLILHEEVVIPSEMIVCSECGGGLTPPLDGVGHSVGDLLTAWKGLDG